MRWTRKFPVSPSWAALAAALTLTSCKPRSPASELRADEVVDVKSSTFPAIKVFRTDRGECVGAIVSPNAVIMAAHCLSSAPGGGVKSQNSAGTIAGSRKWIIDDLDVLPDVKSVSWSHYSGRDLAIVKFDQNLLDFFQLTKEQLFAAAPSPLLSGEDAFIVYKSRNSGTLTLEKVQISFDWNQESIVFSIAHPNISPDVVGSGGLLIDEASGGIAGSVANVRTMDLAAERFRIDKSAGGDAAAINDYAKNGARAYVVYSDAKSRGASRMFKQAIAGGVENFVNSGVSRTAPKVASGRFCSAEPDTCGFNINVQLDSNNPQAVGPQISRVTATGFNPSGRSDGCEQVQLDFDQCYGGACISRLNCQKLITLPNGTGFALASLKEDQGKSTAYTACSGAPTAAFVPVMPDKSSRACGQLRTAEKFSSICNASGKKWVLFKRQMTYDELAKNCRGGFRVAMTSDLQRLKEFPEGSDSLQGFDWWSDDNAADAESDLFGGGKIILTANGNRKNGVMAGNTAGLSKARGACLCDL